MDDNTVAVASTQKAISQPHDAPSIKGDEGALRFADESDIPLEIYEKENVSEYILKALNMDDRMDMLPVKEQDQLKRIEQYIKSRMNDDGYEPTTKAYRAMMNKVQKELGIDKNVSRESLLDRIDGYIEAQGLLNDIKRMNDEKLLKDIRKSKSKGQMVQVVMGAIASHMKSIN